MPPRKPRNRGRDTAPQQDQQNLTQTPPKPKHSELSDEEASVINKAGDLVWDIKRLTKKELYTREALRNKCKTQNERDINSETNNDEANQSRQQLEKQISRKDAQIQFFKDRLREAEAEKEQHLKTIHHQETQISRMIKEINEMQIELRRRCANCNGPHRYRECPLPLKLFCRRCMLRGVSVNDPHDCDIRKNRNWRSYNNHHSSH